MYSPEHKNIIIKICWYLWRLSPFYSVFRYFSRPLKRQNYEQIVADLKNLSLLTRQNPLCSCIICQTDRQKFGSVANAQ